MGGAGQTLAPEIRDADAKAQGREAPGGGKADAGGAPRDDGD
jgi:hypothetical protein